MSIQLKMIINIQYFIIDREKVIFTFVKKILFINYLIFFLDIAKQEIKRAENV